MLKELAATILFIVILIIVVGGIIYLVWTNPLLLFQISITSVLIIMVFKILEILLEK